MDSSSSSSSPSSFSARAGLASSTETLAAAALRPSQSNNNKYTIHDNPDKALAEQLNQLTLQQRQEILDDIHGVSAAIEETPELVRDTLEEMRAELKRHEQTAVSREDEAGRRRCDVVGSQCYARALKMEQQNNIVETSTPCCRKYSLNDDHFLLSFLRAERFQPVKAAERLLKFLHEKETLFGSNRLLQVIELSDLDAETLECLNSGYFQVLPGRDVAGRAIIFATGKLRNFHEPIHLFKTIYMLAMIMAEDVETQRKGMVGIGYSLGQTRTLGMETLSGIGSLLQGLPLRVASFHYCSENAALRMAVNLAALAMGSNHGVRYRFHSGTHGSHLSAHDLWDPPAHFANICAGQC